MQCIANDLTGHVALVTGASRGIGRAIARRLASHGAAVVLNSSPRSSAGLAETQALIEQSGGRAECLELDLSDYQARADLLAKAGIPFGPVDILINNAAGISAYARPSKIDLPARHAMFELNFHAPVDLIQQALPAMRERGWGRIINLTSETVAQPPIPYPGPEKFVHALCLYGASKIALDRYTIGLAAELHGTGVQVNAVKPYKIAVSEGAEALAKQTIATHPDWLESVEMMAEASYLLVAAPLTGLVINSRDTLQMLQQPLRDLDGKTVIGDAKTLFSL